MEDIVERIKYLKDVKKLSFYQIESQLSISRKIASKIYNGNHERLKRVPKLDKYQPLIAEWFKEYPSLKAWQVFDWLRDREINVSYSTVVSVTKKYRKKKEKVYHNLTFLPGEEGQVDWAIINKPSLGKVYCFTLVMSYSRYLFAYLFPRSSFEFFIEGHILAFKAMNGLPHSLRYDNLKSVVTKRKPEITYNSRFLEFCRHYNINIRLCNPGAGNEKGRVERAIRTIKENYFNNTFQCSKITSANAGLLKWINQKNLKLHRSTNKLPIDQFKEEKLQPLPFIGWNNVNIHPPALSTKTAMVHFDRNTYSIPDYLPSKPISIYASPTFVSMYYKDKKIANHPRSFKTNENINNPMHRTFAKLSKTAKYDRIYHVIKDMSPIISTFLKQNEKTGENPTKTAYEIFKLLRSHSRMMIIKICEDCLKRKSARYKTLLSYISLPSENIIEEVNPINSDLLNINYKSRPLEDYDEKP